MEACRDSGAPKAAYDVTMGVITRRKWRVVVDRPPQPGRRDGQIEAVGRTPIMGFRDDVSIRIRPDDDGSKIDVRSASRYGRHDFGGNASRIRSLLEDIEARADTEEKREQRQQQKQQQAKPSPVQAG